MKHSGVVVCGFLLAGGLLLSGDLNAGSLEPPGPPAPTMKTIQQVEPRTPITSLPVTITAPGSYYLTGDLVGVSGQHGIVVNASYVTIDLNGFSLVGVTGSATGIYTAVTGGKHIEIRNGTIRGWGGNGVAAVQFTDVHVESLRVDNNAGGGAYVGAHSIVSATTATGNGGVAGIYADTGSTVDRCTAFGNSGVGIQVQPQSTVSGSTAGNNGTNGFLLSAGSTATDCTAWGNAVGINLAAGSRVTHSVARQNGVGILGSDGASIEQCTADSNTDDGIRVANHSLVRGNFARANSQNGIEASGTENVVEDNEAQQNGGTYSIYVPGTGNIIIKNTSHEYMAWPAGNTGRLVPGGVVTDRTANAWANVLY